MVVVVAVVAVCNACIVGKRAKRSDLLCELHTLKFIWKSYMICLHPQVNVDLLIVYYSSLVDVCALTMM